MKKLQYDVMIPAITEMRRFMIPDNMPIGNCIELITTLIMEEYPQLVKDNNPLKLYLAKEGTLLSEEACLLDYAITTNDLLILA